MQAKSSDTQQAPTVDNNASSSKACSDCQDDIQILETIKEANEIVSARALVLSNVFALIIQPYKFRRGKDRDGEATVSVSNTQLKISTCWSWSTFSDRLDELRNLYYEQVSAHLGGVRVTIGRGYT